ncbi:zinc ribbon domain-containing protein [Patescibacteria group bacterium]|nr:zinc ribbon domain-containing protein [Patescibacteria group bacterium]
MPMNEQEDFGTNLDGNINEEYCVYCFSAGKFVDPTITKDEMVQQVTEFMIQSEKDEPEKVRLAVDRRIRNLRRWQ